MDFIQTIKSYEELKEVLVYRLNEIGHIVRHVEQATCLCLSGFDAYAFINGSLSSEFYPDQGEAGVIVAEWVHVEPWEDWTHEARLSIPVRLLNSGYEEVYNYFKDLLQEEQESWVVSQAHEAIIILSNLKNHNVDLDQLVKTLSEENSDLSFYKERQEFIEKLIKGDL